MLLAKWLGPDDFGRMVFLLGSFMAFKSLIDIKGKPMFVRVIENLHLGEVNPWCIIRQDHIDEYDIDKRIREYYPDAHIIITPSVTEGAACTVRLATNLFGGEEMMVANCDQLMVWNHKEFYETSTIALHKNGKVNTLFKNKHKK